MPSASTAPSATALPSPSPSLSSPSPATPKLRRILIANRGEIAMRVIHACHDTGRIAIAAYADPDADALFVHAADEAYALGGSDAQSTYLNIAAIVETAHKAHVDAVHPGYGFLAEYAEFAQAVIDAGMTWIGPQPATIRALADPDSTPETFGRPGHINPLYAQDRGVLQRCGHTEAAVDFARLAGRRPVAALMEIMSDDGTMARLPELRRRADEWGFKLISIADLIAYRLKRESLVERGEEVDLPTQYGHFRLIPFRELASGLEHVALIKGDLSGDEPVLVRMHSSCITGDTFASRRCECGEQLHRAMEMIEKEGRGAIVYLSQEGRGIGLMDKIRAYKLQEEGLDTVDANLHLGHRADERDYGVGANILHELGIRSMRLLTNNPMKRRALNGYGLKVVETVPLEIEPNDFNRFYMHTKKTRMGHDLHKVD